MHIFVEHTIYASPEEVAVIMFDPDREGEWMSKGSKAERLTPGPLAVGSRVRHEVGVLGWSLSFITEVTGFEPGRTLEMKIVEASDQGAIIYQVVPTSGGAIASIHVEDESMARFPHSVWARKKQAEENLAHLARAVAGAHGGPTVQA
jgi:hypothetical protein